MASKPTVTSYHWQAGPLIRDVEFHAGADARAIAYLGAAEGTDPAALQILRHTLEQKGWATSADQRGGKPVLRLSGLAKSTDLLAALTEQQATTGAPEITAAEQPKPKNTLDAIKQNTLRSSGIFYSVGNALMIISGVLRTRAKDTFQFGQLGSGLAFAAGDVALTIFGGKDDAREFNTLLTKLKAHLHENNIAIPQDAALNAETAAQHHGFVESINDFMHKNINTLKISAEILGGALYAKGGIEDGILEKQIAGGVIVSGWLAALLIKEKKSDPEKLANASWAEKTWAHIQEKPLMLAGGAGLIHNGISALGAYNERKRFLNPDLPNPKGRANTHFYKWDLAVISAMLLGNSLYAMSQKTAGSGMKSDGIVDDVYGLAAQVLANQSPEAQEAAIADTAKFLADRPETKDTEKQIVAKLHAKLDAQRSNPWFEQAAPKPVLGKWTRDEQAATTEQHAPQR